MVELKDSSLLGVGQVFRGARAFTEEDVEQFCAVTRDRIPLHHDEEFARRSRFGRVIVPGLLVASAFSDVLSDWDLLATEVCIKFVAPVYVNETVDISITLTERDGLRMAGHFECRAAGERLAIQGTLKGISMKAVMLDG